MVSTNPSRHQRHRSDADKKKGNDAQKIVEGTERFGHPAYVLSLENDNQENAANLFCLEHCQIGQTGRFSESQLRRRSPGVVPNLVRL